MRLLKPGLCVLALLGCAVWSVHVSPAIAQFVIAPDISGQPSINTPAPSAPTVTRPLSQPLLPGAPQLTARDIDPTQDITLQTGTVAAIYKRASLQNLSQSFIKLTGVDLNDDTLIDDFAIINHCDIYRQHYKNEFAWRQARDAFRRVMQRELESYPENVYLLGSLKLGRYDFEHKAFMLDDESKLERTGIFRFSDRSFSCQGGVVQQIPLNYTFRLTNPITLDRLEMSEERAASIRSIMDQLGNRDRKVYVTFFIRINDFSTQSTAGSVAVRATTRATLMSMRVYLDRSRTQMIYEYTGNQQ